MVPHLHNRHGKSKQPLKPDELLVYQESKLPQAKGQAQGPPQQKKAADH
jgi:hypothetical protein